MREINPNGATWEQLNALSKPTLQHYIKQDDRGNDYVTARYIMNTLDATVGRENWSDSYRLLVIGEVTVVECTISIFTNGHWVSKTDVGGPSKKFSPEKSLFSSAFKRAAFHWGIARDLYGEGNYYVEPGADEDAPPPARPAQPAPADDAPPKTRELTEALGRDAQPLWTVERVRDMLTYAQAKHWDRVGMEEANGAHGYNRLAVALYVKTPAGKPERLAASLNEIELSAKDASEYIESHSNNYAEAQKQEG